MDSRPRAPPPIEARRLHNCGGRPKAGITSRPLISPDDAIGGGARRRDVAIPARIGAEAPFREQLGLENRPPVPGEEDQQRLALQIYL